MKSVIMFLLMSFSCLALSHDTRIVVISDLNGSYGSATYGEDVHRAVKQISLLKPDLVISTGDMIAGQKSGLNYNKMWAAFHQAVTTPLINAKIPLAVTVGNHDGSGYPQYKNERNIFIGEWKKYRPLVNFSSEEFYPQYYSFIFKDRLFISLDSTIVGAFSAQQMFWLEAELKKHQKIKHKILFTHVPLFGFAQMSGTGFAFDPFLYSLLNNHQVTFYLTGHHHAYYPGFNQGTHYVSQGCLGAAPRKLQGMDTVSPRTITVIDFVGEDFEVYAYRGPMFKEKLDHGLLPASLDSDTVDIILKDKSL